jgi:hypothetical protein
MEHVPPPKDDEEGEEELVETRVQFQIQPWFHECLLKQVELNRGLNANEFAAGWDRKSNGKPLPPDQQRNRLKTIRKEMKKYFVRVVDNERQVWIRIAEKVKMIAWHLPQEPTNPDMSQYREGEDYDEEVGYENREYRIPTLSST